MIELCRLIRCGLIGLFRSRASLEAENLALRHQINVLRRWSPKRPTFNNVDRLVFVGLYGLAHGVLSALAIVRPETVSLASPWVSSLLAMENRHGLAVAGTVTFATGTAERRASEICSRPTAA
jgi:hypothetical protein